MTWLYSFGSFVFGENSRTPKSPFEIIWPLLCNSFDTILWPLAILNIFIRLQFDEIFMRDLFYLRLNLTNLIAKMQKNKNYVSTWNRISSHRIIALYVNSIKSKPTFNMGRLLFFQWYFLFEFERSNRSFSSTGKLGPPPSGLYKVCDFPFNWIISWLLDGRETTEEQITSKAILQSKNRKKWEHKWQERLGKSKISNPKLKGCTGLAIVATIY